MFLKGDLNSISLNEVLRLITSSGKEGSLIVSDVDSKKIIYFSRSGVRLLSTGIRRGLRIGELLVKSGLITGEQLAQALQVQKSSHLKLGEILTQLNLIKTGDIQRLVRFQIEEEIYDLFNWKDATFEFVEGPPHVDLVESDQPAIELELDINALLAEANRRLEEWKSIRQVLTNTKSVYTLTEETEERLRKADLPDIFKAIVPLINGLKTVDDIVEECSLVSSFEAYKAIYLLITKGLITEVSFDDIRNNARQLLKSNKPEQALLLYHQAVKMRPDDVTVNQNLAEVMERLTRQSEAGEQYKKLGELLDKKNMQAQAALAYQKALAYLPEDEYIHIRIFDRAVLSKQIPEAILIAKQLLKLYSKSKDAQKVTALAEKLYNLKPPDFEIRAYISSAYFSIGDYEKSKTELANAIKELPSQKPSVLLKAYEDVLKIEPNHSDARYQRDIIYKRVSHKRKIKHLLVAAGVLMILLVLAAGGVVWYDRYYIKSKFMALKPEIDQLKADKRYHEAIKKCQEFNYALAWTTNELVKKEIAVIQDILAKSAQARADAIKAEFKVLADLFNKAEQTEIKKELVSALILYRELLEKTSRKYQEIFTIEQPDLPDYEGRKKEFSQLTGKIDSKVKEVSQYLQSAESLYRQVQEFDKADNLPEATKLIYQLVNTYPFSPLVEEVRIPIKIESVPFGAEVWLDKQKQGVTPLKVYLPLKGGVNLQLTKKGFSPVERQIKAYGQSVVKLSLEKITAWVFRSGGPIESTPLVLTDFVMLTSRDGNLYALDRVKGDLKWRFKTDISREIVSSPKFNTALSGIVFGCYDSALYAVKYTAMNATKLWAVKTSALIKASPFFSPDNSTIFMGSTDNQLYAFSSKGDVLWKFQATGKISNDGISDENMVYLPSDEGNLYAIDNRTGVEKWRLTLSDKLSSLAKENNTLYVGTNNNTCHAIDLTTRQIKWTHKTKGGVMAAPGIFNDTIFITSQDKALYAVNASNGKQKWVFMTKGPISGGVAVAPDGVVYLGSEDNYIYAINAETGQEIWRYKTNGKIRGSPAVFEDMLYIGSDDFSLYALER